MAVPRHNFWKHDLIVVDVYQNSQDASALQISCRELQKTGAKYIRSYQTTDCLKTVLIMSAQGICSQHLNKEIQKFDLHNFTNRRLLGNVPNGTVIKLDGVIGRTAPTVIPLRLPRYALAPAIKVAEAIHERRPTQEPSLQGTATLTQS